jgi:hypothetical protein
MFWPFQSNQSSSYFLNAVAANHDGPGNAGNSQAWSHGNIRFVLYEIRSALIANLVTQQFNIHHLHRMTLEWRDNVNFVFSAIEMAAAKAAQHRLRRGIWTNVRFGDMRRALAGTTLLFHLDFVVYTRKVWCNSWIIRPLTDYAKSPRRYYLKQGFALLYR